MNDTSPVERLLGSQIPAKEICVFSLIQACLNSIFRFMPNWLSLAYSVRLSLSSSNSSRNVFYGKITRQ